MSATQIWLGRSVVKFCFNKLPATEKLCLEVVVALYFLFVLAAMPFSRINQATRFLLYLVPYLLSALVTLGLP